MEPYIDLDSSGFSPDEFADVKLCLETLFSIQESTQPLDRELGLNLDEVDSYPLNIAENALALEIIEKTRTYEPRAEVDSVTFEADTNGQIRPHIYFVKSEE